MDKNEFKTKYDEIKQLIKEGRTDEALDIVESTNWRKVHNVNALVKASEVCEEAGRLEEARELLYMAHDRSPIGRMIIYHLAILCVKLGDLDEAKEFYDEFVEIAPHDSLKYIIKYQINKAKGADYTTLIGILEELKEHDFLEEWAYELAYLYHKTMQVDKCIDLCDEIILWFGDGPYVERALEMKMIYQPLDKMQEDKYRHFQQRRDGVTEIRANEILHSGEIVHETMAIPQVELPAERFNTVNLQAEIKKNIDEIMRATEAEAVSENMENIKTLVEEIPYLQVNEQSDAIAEEQKQAKQELDESLKDTFNEYLAEEYDGQISLLVPESKEVEQQVDGQMTIEDVMEEWEKTRRAAEAALQEAEQQKLESAKNIALKEASQIMDRLEEAIPKLDAGARPTDLLKEEYMAKQDEASSEPVKDRTEDPAPAVFQIPKVAADGVMGVGLEIPVVDPASAHIIKGEESPEAPSIVKSVEPDASEKWHPPVLEDQDEKADPAQEASLPEEADLEEVTDVDYKEASKIVADVNDMLQQEIDRIMANEGQEEVRHLEEEALASEVAEEIAPDVEEDDLPEITLPEDLQEFVAEAETAESEVDPQEAVAEEAMPSREQEVAEEPLPEIADVVLDPEEMAELLDENVLERAISEEMPELTLSEEEKEIFSYFMPIDGMENTICQALTGVRYRLENKKNSASGNIIIQGGVGSGKTMLASNLIKVLQIETDKLTGNVGKIDAEQLNKKDVALVLSKVSGGCLIIEGAGRLSERTQETMRQLMSQENCDVLVLMEDQKKRIDKMLSHNSAFAAMFTEKITIPIFTIDELVNFGKVYALEEGYVVDEMAILAMYNRINLIQRVDHPTSLIEVRDIVESAIDKAEKGGIKAMFSRFGSKRYDEDGNLILREQDFEL
ncbi:MAG: tetratricopeptide repeat protein [Roseburia lenta]|nr:tetratricopeptide repeat protein [Roseburia lenta]